MKTLGITRVASAWVKGLLTEKTFNIRIGEYMSVLPNQRCQIVLSGYL